MAIFGFFKRPKPRSFGFIPRYYDADKEALESRLKKYEDDEQGNTDLMKQRIRSGFRRKQPVPKAYRNAAVRRSNWIVLGVLAMLIFVTLLFFNEYLPRIMQAFE